MPRPRAIETAKDRFVMTRMVARTVGQKDFRTAHALQQVTSNDRVPDFRGYPFADNHGRNDNEQDQRHLRPVELRDRGIELKSNPACADKPENGGLANID